MDVVKELLGGLDAVASLGALNRTPRKAVAGLADWKALTRQPKVRRPRRTVAVDRNPPPTGLCAVRRGCVPPPMLGPQRGWRNVSPEAPAEFSRVDAARRGMGGVWRDDDGEPATSTSLGSILLHLPPTEPTVVPGNGGHCPRWRQGRQVSLSWPGGWPSGRLFDTPAETGCWRWGRGNYPENLPHVQE